MKHIKKIKEGFKTPMNTFLLIEEDPTYGQITSCPIFAGLYDDVEQFILNAKPKMVEIFNAEDPNDVTVEATENQIVFKYQFITQGFTLKSVEVNKLYL
ncbi:MAG: hypothetical protein JXA99_01960 [Candidatus Lokiarchaeota archaeon]|nr:hypothetical protein [Candidatus Lokiarchaeota archaeon]